jgi:hypothetical protein
MNPSIPIPDTKEIEWLASRLGRFTPKETPWHRYSLDRRLGGARKRSGRRGGNTSSLRFEFSQR